MSPELEKAARAVAEVRERYAIGQDRDCGNFVWDDRAEDEPFSGSYAECEAWINAQIARAVFESALPVSDAVRQALRDMEPVYDDPWVSSEEYFTAAIRHIVGEAREDG